MESGKDREVGGWVGRGGGVNIHIFVFIGAENITSIFNTLLELFRSAESLKRQSGTIIIHPLKLA